MFCIVLPITFPSIHKSISAHRIKMGVPHKMHPGCFTYMKRTENPIQGRISTAFKMHCYLIHISLPDAAKLSHEPTLLYVLMLFVCGVKLRKTKMRKTHSYKYRIAVVRLTKYVFLSGGWNSSKLKECISSINQLYIYLVYNGSGRLRIDCTI